MAMMETLYCLYRKWTFHEQNEDIANACSFSLSFGSHSYLNLLLQYIFRTGKCNRHSLQFQNCKAELFFLPNDLLFLIFRKTNQISSKLQGIPVNCQNNNKEITVSPIRFPSLFPQLCPFFSAHCMNVIPLFSLSLYIYFLILLLLSSYLVSTVLAVYMIL